MPDGRRLLRRARSSRMKAMPDNFLQILPEVIFAAAETLGGRCTGRFYALNALENRVYDIEIEEGPHVVVKFYRPGRWSRATIQAEHDFLKALEESEIPVVAPLRAGGGGERAAPGRRLEREVWGGELLNFQKDGTFFRRGLGSRFETIVTQ